MGRTEFKSVPTVASLVLNVAGYAIRGPPRGAILGAAAISIAGWKLPRYRWLATRGKSDTPCWLCGLDGN